MNIIRHIEIFDLIAPIYGWFFGYQVRNYRRIVGNNLSFFQDADCSVLDIGCGTGALAFVLSKLGCEVTGLDGSERMIIQAKRLNHGNTANFIVGNALSLTLPQFDLVIASYVVHGLVKDQRQKLYSEMKRLALKHVIIMDYNQNRGVLTSIIEWLEHGDYFNFVKSAEKEMQQVFANVQIIQTGKRSAWYICDM